MTTIEKSFQSFDLSQQAIDLSGLIGKRGRQRDTTYDVLIERLRSELNGEKVALSLTGLNLLARSLNLPDFKDLSYARVKIADTEKRKTGINVSKMFDMKSGQSVLVFNAITL